MTNQNLTTTGLEYEPLLAETDPSSLSIVAAQLNMEIPNLIGQKNALKTKVKRYEQMATGWGMASGITTFATLMMLLANDSKSASFHAPVIAIALCATSSFLCLASFAGHHYAKIKPELEAERLKSQIESQKALADKVRERLASPPALMP